MAMNDDIAYLEQLNQDLNNKQNFNHKNDEINYLEALNSQLQAKEQANNQQQEYNNSTLGQIGNFAKSLGKGALGIGAGILQKAIVDPITGIAQFANDATGNIADKGLNALGLPSIDQWANNLNNNYQDFKKYTGDPLYSGTAAEAIGGVLPALVAPEIKALQNAGIGTKVGASALLGGIQGALQPIYGTNNNQEQRTQNEIFGGAVGAGLPLISPIIAGVTGLGRNAKVASEIAKNSNMNNEDLAKLVKKNYNLVEGSNPTLTEILPTPTNIAQYNRLKNKGALINGDTPLTQRLNENNLARVNALQKVAGTPQELDALKDFRSTQAQNSYNNLPPVPINDELKYALSQPYVSKELKQAQQHFNAELDPNNRLKVISGTTDNLNLNPQAVNQITRALNNSKYDAFTTGLSTDDVILANKQADLFNKAIDKINPEFANARTEYAINSMPITNSNSANRLLGYPLDDKGEVILDLNKNSLNSGGNIQLNKGNYQSTLAQLLREKFKPSEEVLKNTFYPIQKDLERQSVLNSKIGTAGSDTSFNQQNELVGNIAGGKFKLAQALIDALATRKSDKQAIDYILNPQKLSEQLTSKKQYAFDKARQAQPYLGGLLAKALQNYIYGLSENEPITLEPITVTAPRK
jgi:hypothetical protein